MTSIRYASSRVAAACATLLAATCHNASAQLSPAPLPNEASVLTSFPDGQLNHWYVSRSDTLVGVAGETASEDARDSSAFMDLANISRASVSGRDDGASASSLVQATKLSVGAASHTNDTFSGTHAMAYAMADIGYMTIMDRPGTVKLKFHLSGLLYSRSFDADAGMSLMAYGTGFDEGLLPDLGDQDLDPIQAIKLLPRINDAHLQLFSAVHENGFDGTWRYDQDFSVLAEGVPFACPESGAGRAYCGKYLYAFGLGITAATRNSAEADFSHTLTMTELTLPEGASLTFNEGASIPVHTSAVPEASTWVMSTLGLGMLAGLTARRRQRA